MDQKKGTVLRTAFDAYKIQGQRGSGASGEVFEAVDSDGVLRAVKILHGVKPSPVGLKRSRDDFNFCFRSSHRNILPVLDCGLTGSLRAVFYVMPLYARSLRDCIMKGIPSENVLRIFGNILDGMEAAHLHGIWHLDLKPENLLTNEDGRDLVIADFGVAHCLEDKLFAAANDVEGFPYAAPEQRKRGAAVDGKADVYALGLILREMFTGQTKMGLGHRDIGDVAPDFAYLDWTVGRMTNPEPTRRLSITEVKRELIARGNEFLSIQRLNSLKSVILRETEVDDPFIANPIAIQSIDFKAETLYLTLSAIPPPRWVMAFHGSGSHSGFAGNGPDRFVFLGKLAHMRIARGADPLQLVDRAKAYVAEANRHYAEMAVAAHREYLETERKKHLAQIAAEERRQHVLARVRL
jgi:serine/threonine protein kinase